MLSKSSTEFMSILYQFFKIGYGIGLVIICVAVICYAYRIISLNKKVKKDKKGKKAFRENKMQAKENLKLWVLGGGLVVIATFCARSIIPLGEEIVSGPASAGNAGNHEWLICIGVAFIFIVLTRKSNSEECDDERREKDNNSKK
jgi:hypothetical protein